MIKGAANPSSFGLPRGAAVVRHKVRKVAIRVPDREKPFVDRPFKPIGASVAVGFVAGDVAPQSFWHKGELYRVNRVMDEIRFNGGRKVWIETHLGDFVLVGRGSKWLLEGELLKDMGTAERGQGE